jgi:hypothetical protein
MMLAYGCAFVRPIAKLAALVLEHLELRLAAVKVARLECD